MFALVRKCDNTAVISPTPTRASFPARSFVPMPAVARTPSPTSSTSSVSSSASSISRPSSRSSIVSSVSSLASSLPSKPAVYVPPAKARRSNPKVFIDMTKKDVTRYSYQGGVSTVLTGGVMLGGPPACSNSWRRV
ncbi:hypothetical protein BD779DRAFT_1561079 [Infundibulicybe gibba]|nr:hypothetical protein BD779DRAFT_1561079 [Infundibulicybe gibba]